MSHAFSSLDELGHGYGFRPIRKGLGITAFGANAIVMPAGYEGFQHFHDTQDELYFVHAGTARIDIDGDTRLLGPGGLFHATSTTTRKVSSAGPGDLVLIVVGAQNGYVERDGHLADPERDLERRTALGRGDIGDARPG